MEVVSHLTDLFRHMGWADALTWHAVLMNPSAVCDSATRERLHHIHLCQHAWLHIWLGQPVDPQAGVSLSIIDLASWARQYHEGVWRYLADVRESHLDLHITVPGMDEAPQQPALWETFLQVAGHTTYHRGQVSSRLREIGGQPPATDFIKWVVLGKPKAEWPEATCSR
jgi:uncharacterized damage-inducible protein DinB